MNRSFMKWVIPCLFLAVASLAQAGDSDPLATANFAANPFQGVCQGTSFLSRESYQKNQAFWDSAINDCHAKVEVLPEGGFTNWVEGVMGRTQDQAEAADFLKKVGQRALATQEFNNKVSELLIHCAGDPQKENSWFTQMQSQSGSAEEASFNKGFYDQSKCEARIQDQRSVIAEKGSDFRVKLALMKKVAGNGSKLASKLRDILGATLAGESVPLTAAEQARADQIDKADASAATAKLKDAFAKGFAKIDEFQRTNPGQPVSFMAKSAIGDPSVASWIQNLYLQDGPNALGNLNDNPVFTSAVASYRANNDFNHYFQDYSKDLSDARILAYLDKSNPSKEDIANAAAALLKNGQKDIDTIQAQLRETKWQSACSGRAFCKLVDTKVPLSDQEKVSQRIDLLQNGNVVRDLLSETPSSCRIAAGLVNYETGQNTKNGILATAGLVGASVVAGFVAGPAVLAAGGVSISAAGLASGSVAFAGSSAMAMADWNAYKASEQRTFSVAHSEEGKFGAGKALNDVSQYQDSRNQVAFDAALNVAMAAGSLAKPTAQLISAAAKKTPEFARMALKVLKDAAGKDPEEAKIYTGMLAKGGLGPDGDAQVAQYSKAFQAMDPAKRKQVYGAMQTFFDSIKDGDLNPGTRADALRAVIAADKFGQGDVSLMKRAYANFRDWDSDSLKGLTGTYERAAENMELPEIKSIQDPLERRNAALKKALDDMGVKEKPNQEKMAGCAGSLVSAAN